MKRLNIEKLEQAYIKAEGELIDALNELQAKKDAEDGCVCVSKNNEEGERQRLDYCLVPDYEDDDDSIRKRCKGCGAYLD